ncbi:alcohol dehydrogenase catalytic domain-containing protein [Pectobacterium brasiliense]|uniref:alcohol dehydrogenase catalytic domain-containing protein n=1 Tax=Pectobacterium brasiliense TaxID=180957 RepID=UPI00404480AF
MKTVVYAASYSYSKLAPHQLLRRDLFENDVAIEILFCGVCHSDLHTVNGDWGPQPYPLVPGYEIVGVVASVGHGVKNLSLLEKGGIAHRFVIDMSTLTIS